jgi:hypothetical protein
MVAIVSPPLLQTVLTLLMSEVWASDRKVFFGISIRPLKHGQLFIRLYYHKSVSYTLAKERMRYLWSDSVLAKLKTISVVHEPCTVPMPTPPHSYQQNAHLYIRLGTSIDRHVLAKKVFYDLNMNYLFEHGFQNSIWVAGHVPLHYNHKFQHTNVFHSLLQRDQVESWRAPVYHILLWILQNPDSTCYAINFTILDDHSVGIKVQCAENAIPTYLDVLRTYYEIE